MDALIEGTIGLHKTELITAQRFWTGRGQVERETAEWVRWLNTVLRKASRLLMHKGIHTRQVAPLEGRISLSGSALNTTACRMKKPSAVQFPYQKPDSPVWVWHGDRRDQGASWLLAEGGGASRQGRQRSDAFGAGVTDRTPMIKDLRDSHQGGSHRFLI